MIFSSPLFLYLLPAAGLPILFHFLLKQKKRHILFPTLMFFYQTEPRLNARRKLHQLLLLMMRVLLILFMLLALARPHFQSAVPMGGKISVVVVVDNSGSMSDQAGDDQTKLDLAIQGAKHLISSLGQQARMNVVTLVGDPNTPVGHSLISDKDVLLSVVGKITPTAATGHVGSALAKASALLRADAGSGGVVHVFSDLQETEWHDETLHVDMADPALRIVLHRIATAPRTQANVALSALQFPRQIILPKHPLTIGVVCRNTSQVSATIRVNSVDDQAVKQTRHLTLKPGVTRTVEVSTQPDRPGFHWMRTWIEGDGFSADNEAGVGILCRETSIVTFDGTQGEFGVLPTALSPDEFGQFTGLVSQFGRITDIPQTEEERPLLIVTTWDHIDRANDGASAFRAYVEQGGNLLVVPGPRPVSVSVPTPDWLGAAPQPRVSFGRGAEMEVLNRESEFWHRICAATEDVSLGTIRALTFYPLQLTEGFTPLIGTSDTQVMLAHKKFGSGHCYVSGTAFDPRWNTLPLTGLMVIMAQSMVVQASTPERDAMLTLVAGDTPTGLHAGTQTVTVHTLTGQRLDWQGPAGDMPVFAQPGAYRIQAGDRQYAVSVCASPREGLMQFVNGSRIPAFHSLTHEILDFDPEEGFAQYHQGQSRTFNLFLPLLLMATVALLAEGWLANPVRIGSDDVIPSLNASDYRQGTSTHTTLESVGQSIPATRGDA